MKRIGGRKETKASQGEKTQQQQQKQMAMTASVSVTNYRDEIKE
jgi:hypothetical protein